MLEPGRTVESWTSSGSMPGGMNSWDSKEEEGRGLVVGVLESLKLMFSSFYLISRIVVLDFQVNVMVTFFTFCQTCFL